MATKPIKWYIKLQINGWQANPAPPVGPALWQHWVAIPEFIKRFNDETKDRMGMKLPVIITVYEDRSFDFVVKQPPAWYLIKDKLKLKSGSKVAQKEKVGHLSLQQLKEIATMKMVDMNANDIAWAMLTIDGTARQMWVTSDIHGKTITEVREMIK